MTIDDETRDPTKRVTHLTSETIEIPRIDSMEVARLAPNAMINDLGDVFYPDDDEDAVWFATEHGARPLSPCQFPYKIAFDTSTLAPKTGNAEEAT